MLRRWPALHVGADLPDDRQGSRRLDPIDARQINPRELVEMGAGIEVWLVAAAAVARFGGWWR